MPFTKLKQLDLSTVGDHEIKTDVPLSAIDLVWTFSGGEEYDPRRLKPNYLQTVFAGLKISAYIRTSDGQTVDIYKRIPASVLAEFTENGNAVTEFLTADGSTAGKVKTSACRMRLLLGLHTFPMQNDENLVVVFHVGTAIPAVVDAWPYRDVRYDNLFNHILEVNVPSESAEKTYDLGSADFVLFPYSAEVLEFEFGFDEEVSKRPQAYNWHNLRANDLLQGEVSFMLDNTRIAPSNNCVIIPAADLARVKIEKNLTAYTFYIVSTKEINKVSAEAALKLNMGA
jgi:hypothetical protein